MKHNEPLESRRLADALAELGELDLSRGGAGMFIAPSPRYG